MQITWEFDAGSNAGAVDAQRQSRLAPSDVTEGSARDVRGAVRAEYDCDFRCAVRPDFAVQRLYAHDVINEQKLVTVDQLHTSPNNAHTLPGQLSLAIPPRTPADNGSINMQDFVDDQEPSNPNL